MTLYHVTTPKKVQRYHVTGYIKKPVRGFTTLMAALAWGCKVGRSVVLAIDGTGSIKLPDHHNRYGEARWVDENIHTWKCIISPKKV